MFKFLLVVPLLLTQMSLASAQDAPGASVSLTNPGRPVITKPNDIEGEAAKSRAAADKMYRRINESARRGVRSMCDECLGPRYNRPGPKTPLIVPDEPFEAATAQQFEMESQFEVEQQPSIQP